VDAGPRQSRVLGSSLVHVVDAVCRSGSFVESRCTLLGSLSDCGGSYHVDVAVALHCCGRLGVGAAVSVKHAAAASGCISSLSCCQLGVMVLLLARRLLLDTATVDAPGSDARLLAHTPCCHAPGGQWRRIRLSRSNVQLPPLTVSPHCLGAVFVRW
jgi:hypothetical protein